MYSEIRNTAGTRTFRVSCGFLVLEDYVLVTRSLNTVTRDIRVKTGVSRSHFF